MRWPLKAIVAVCIMMVLPGAGSAAGKDAAPPAEIDFQNACGIPRDKLETMVGQAIRQNGTPMVPLMMVLYDSAGDCLAEADATIVWKDGSQKVHVPQSGLILFPLNASRLQGLKIVAPPGYTVLKQMSFSEGPAFQRMKAEDPGVPLVDDSEIKECLRQRLLQIARDGGAAAIDTFQEQLKRKHCSLKLAAPPAKRLTPEEIYQRCRKSVVVVGTLTKSGQLMAAGGFVLGADGVVVTNYHVMNKTSSSASAIGVRTFDGNVYAVKEVLAASRPTDIAIVRIAARGLPAVELSDGEQPGAPVTVIAHPAGRFYYLTHGYVSRYSGWVNYGQPMIGMSITAEYCPGSSGSPVFSATGAVAGIVSSVHELGGGMVDKQAMPAKTIRALVEPEK